MDQIKWCCNQKKGIELVEPSDNLNIAYIHKAQEALETLRTTKSKSWQLIMAYYVVYNSLYSLLMKCGVKCEIHSCTIEFAKKYFKPYFSLQDFELIDDAFKARIDAQYYVTKEVSQKKHRHIIKKIPSFLVKCKNIILEQTKIKKLREDLFLKC